MLGPVLRKATSVSPLLHALSTTRDHPCVLEARHLSRVCRDGVEVRCGELMLFAGGAGKKMVACVQEMAEVLLPGGAVVRLWCSHRRSLEGVTEDADGMFRLAKHADKSCAACVLLVRLEKVCVTQLQCQDRNRVLHFRYLF